MPKYPGLGLPLRYVLLPGDVLQPEHEESSGVEKSFSNAVSLPLAVRELAMMSIMEAFTDKLDWHKKVFDERTVAKWREETREIPDEHFWNLADAFPYARQHTHQTESPARILNDVSFEYVSQSHRLCISFNQY
jgi:hypothetical protein